MVDDSAPPYQVLQTGALDAATVRRLARFARYWDLVANSGRFAGTLALLLADAPFDRFMAFADWLHTACGQTHAIPAERLFALAHRWLVATGTDPQRATAVLAGDYRRSGARGRLELGDVRVPVAEPRGRRRLASRQSRHRAP
jgi:hypothetical protein